MAEKGKKQLTSSAWWRVDDIEDFQDTKLRLTSQPAATSTMHIPRTNSNNHPQDEDSIKIDPELCYSFQHNFQFLQRVFSIDTAVKPLPPAMGYNVPCNLNFFTRIFTQFFGMLDSVHLFSQLRVE